MKAKDYFPPYGALAIPYAKQILEPKAPADFISNDKEYQWTDWIDNTVEILNDCLWPSWNYSRNDWDNPNYNLMNKITEADFVIMKELQDDNYLEKTYPESLVKWIANHKSFFEDEDQDRLGDRIGEYSSEFPKEIWPYSKLISKIFLEKIGTTSMQLKSRLQRPRPYQVSSLVGASWFSWNLGATSMSPSMSSGHALQGLLFAAGTFEDFLQRGIKLSNNARDGLEQFGVDVGDRRVFAGIHYPSDNIASWISAVRLAKKVFRRDETKDFIRSAIINKSEIYKRISGFSKDNASYHNSVSILNNELNNI